MCTVTVADIGSVHRISHKNVDEGVVERATRLKEFEIRKCGIDISADGVEPQLFFCYLLTFPFLNVFLHILCSLQGLSVGVIS